MHGRDAGPIYPIVLVTLPVTCIIAHAKAPGVDTTCTNAVFGIGFVGSQTYYALIGLVALDDIGVPRRGIGVSCTLLDGDLVLDDL